MWFIPVWRQIEWNHEWKDQFDPKKTRLCKYLVCSGSVVVTAYDSESGRPGSNPEWGLIYYEASITAQGLPEP